MTPPQSSELFDNNGVLQGLPGDALATHIMESVLTTVSNYGWDQPPLLFWLTPPVQNQDVVDALPDSGARVLLAYGLELAHEIGDVDDLVGLRAPATAAGLVFVSEAWLRLHNQSSQRAEVRMITWMTRAGSISTRAVLREPNAALDGIVSSAIQDGDGVAGRLPAYLAAILGVKAEPPPFGAAVGSAVLRVAEQAAPSLLAWDVPFEEVVAKSTRVFAAMLTSVPPATDSDIRQWLEQPEATFRSWVNDFNDGQWANAATYPGKRILLGDDHDGWAGPETSAWNAPNLRIGPHALNTVIEKYGPKTGRAVAKLLSAYGWNPEHIQRG